MNKKHFLITLFNLQLWHADKTKTATHTDEWLAKRFQLFETYCLPSVSQQTTKDFIWLCLLDENTPAAYKERIEQYRQQVPQLTPCYFTKEHMANWEGHLKEIIRSLLNGADYVMTTNLDNDDSIHRNMLEHLQSTFDQSEKIGLYTYIDGIQYFPKTGLILNMKYPHNHFLTSIEDTHVDFQTIKSVRHAKARKNISALTDITDKPYWIEIVHATNVNNDLRITSRIKYTPRWRSISLQDYGLNIRRSWQQNCYCNLVVWPGLFLKTACRKLLRKMKKTAE